MRAIEPLASFSSPSDRFQSLTRSSGSTDSRPLSPSTHTSRPSANRGTTMPRRCFGSPSIRVLDHSAADRVLWVGIIVRPARNRCDGESTAMHLTGTDGTCSQATMYRWAVRLACVVVIRTAVAFRASRKTWCRGDQVTRQRGPTSLPSIRARSARLTGLWPSETANSKTPSARACRVVQNST